MKKVLTLVVISIILWGCSGKTPEIKRIPLTTTSPEAERLFREVLINNEHGRSYLNTNLFNQINKLDPTFVFVKLFEKWPPNPENLQYVLERSDSISDYERRFAKIITEMTKANMIGALEYIKKLIDDYPDFYETREFASIVFTYALDVEGAQAQLSKAIELNPQSFNAHMKLAQLHFDKGGGSGTKGNEIMLPIEKRDLDYAERLLQRAQDILPDSPQPKVALGNLYLSRGNLDEAEKILESGRRLFSNKKDLELGNILSALGTVSTFMGRYDEARSFLDEASKLQTPPDNTYWGSYMPKFESLRKSILTHIFERKYGEAVVAIDAAQEIIKSDNLQRGPELYLMSELELLNAKTLGHSLQNQESKNSLKRYEQLSIKGGFLMTGGNPDDFELSKNQATWLTPYHTYHRVSLDIILQDFDSAREGLKLFEKNLETWAAFDPRYTGQYKKLVGQLNLMENNLENAISAYASINKDFLTSDMYHTYFFALAQKAVGNLEESEKMFQSINDYYTYNLDLAFVKQLAKEQLASW